MSQIKHKKRIAVLTRAGYSYHQEISWGFLSMIENQKKYLQTGALYFFYAKRQMSRS